MNAIETIEREGFTIELSYDELCGDSSPREWSNCSILAQLSTRFTQPDKSDWRADALIEAWNRFDRDTVKIERYARAFLNAVAIQWWDDPRSESRIIGIIDRDTAVKELLDDPAETLKSELEIYAQWCNGEVYSYLVTGPDGEFIDSCGDIYGDNYALSEANAVVDAEIADRHAKRVQLYRKLVNAR